MAYMVARTQKHKVGSLNGLQNHVDRKTKNHTNKDIDITKSDLNYDLVRDTREKTFLSDVTEYIEKNKTSKRAIRKDAVLVNEWLISSSKDFFDGLTESDTKQYFETALDYFSKEFGRENIRFAVVHLDEKTPHMHLGIVPMRDGKLTSKTIFNRAALRKIQDDLPKFFQQHGFDIQRGNEGSIQEHVRSEVYKREVERVNETLHQTLDQAHIGKKEVMTIDRFDMDTHEVEYFDKVEPVTKRLERVSQNFTHQVQGLMTQHERKQAELKKERQRLAEKEKELVQREAEMFAKIESKTLEQEKSLEVSKQELNALESKIEGYNDELSSYDDLFKQKSEKLKEFDNQIEFRQRHLGNIEKILNELPDSSKFLRGNNLIHQVQDYLPNGQQTDLEEKAMKIYKLIAVSKTSQDVQSILAENIKLKSEQPKKIEQAVEKAIAPLKESNSRLVEKLQKQHEQIKNMQKWIDTAVKVIQDFKAILGEKYQDFLTYFGVVMQEQDIRNHRELTENQEEIDTVNKGSRMSSSEKSQWKNEKLPHIVQKEQEIEQSLNHSRGRGLSI